MLQILAVRLPQKAASHMKTKPFPAFHTGIEALMCKTGIKTLFKYQAKKHMPPVPKPSCPVFPSLSQLVCNDRFMQTDDTKPAPPVARSVVF
ncbi:hypothetical protein TH25_21395 [Thalassospira profundimaris]|uniref:Uncharacterized protein n=1 Tax=Thalassospira profundimaris TaxID=502049 RepID=A0A367WS69_9PROT|nr:hypothetical protein TH25_21395 [Thalassospira profundimaris]